MPRRIYTYAAESGWGPLNFVATLGGAMIAVSVLLFIVNAVRSLRHGAPAGDNPWGAASLEWATPSPPPPSNFAAIPVVGSEEPLWEPRPVPASVSGLSNTTREVLATSLLDAQPSHRYQSPKPSIWPFVTAVATTVLFIASMFTAWAVVWGSIPVAIAAIGWFWPKPDDTQEHLALEKRP
jgi:cytochrome c oxidase subunit 1